MVKINRILLKALGLLLLIAAALKGWQIMNEPVANKDIWTNRAFLILTVEFELLMAIWLLSGLFRKLAWLASLVCFSVFSFVTLYRALIGAASCGCFGSVHVNPWITLFTIDIPAVILLLIFRPAFSWPSNLSVRKRQSIVELIKTMFSPWPPVTRLAATVLLAVIVVAVTTPVLALNKPADVTGDYEVLKPETWIGEKLPLLENIEIEGELTVGNWLIVFYHYDCPDCREAIDRYKTMAKDFENEGNFLKFAFIEIPPYGPDLGITSSAIAIGSLPDTKQWLVNTPVVVFLKDGKAAMTWEAEYPDFDEFFSYY